MDQKAWVQAAIDVEDIDLAKRIAFMALDAGAEWLEVGTPLLYQYGHAAIGMLRKAVGRNVVLVADYKSPFGGLCAPQAKREGADYVMLSAGYIDWALRNCIDVCREVEIEPIFDLAVRPDDLIKQAEKLTAMGAKYLFARHYAFSAGPGEESEKIDVQAMLNEGEKNYFLGITSDDFEEAQDSVRMGADWITFGGVLRKPDPEICRRWIDAIHNAR